MRIVNLQAENYRILKAIEITPDGNVVTIGGKNGSGKSSILSAIWVALAGRSKAPPTPIRKGEEECRIVLDLGEIVVTRKFTAKDDGTYTDSVKVESADGKQRYQKPQQMLDDLLGQIGFDPLAFVQMKSDAQAETLLAMVPLPIDIEELAREDAADFANRRDINRDAAALKAQAEALPEFEIPADAPDREALMAKLTSAADHNTAIERDRMARNQMLQRREGVIEDGERAALDAKGLRERAAQLIEQAQKAEAEAETHISESEHMRVSYDALAPLGEPIDTEAVRAELAAADTVLRDIDQERQRAALVAQHTAKVAEAQRLTDMMDAREEDRRKALAGAKMPIAGLGFAVNDKGKPVVLFNGLPFGDASSAEQIRASTAIAMAANPELRVLQIKDGSLLDDDSLAVIASMAADDDFQVFVERVSSGGVGIIIEDGSIKAPDQPEEKPKAKADAPADKLL